MPPPPQQHGAGVSTFDKMKMGAVTGTAVGLTIGFIFGGVSILRSGPGPRGLVATLSQYMLSSAATFGFFMSIGSVIRTDSPYGLRANDEWRQAWLAARRRRLAVEVVGRPRA
ncbi:subunit of TIM23 translocase complex [Cryptotrichosporon argae]